MPAVTSADVNDANSVNAAPIGAGRNVGGGALDVVFKSKADHPRMRAFSCAWSLPVT